MPPSTILIIHKTTGEHKRDDVASASLIQTLREQGTDQRGRRVLYLIASVFDYINPVEREKSPLENEK